MDLTDKERGTAEAFGQALADKETEIQRLRGLVFMSMFTFKEIRQLGTGEMGQAIQMCEGTLEKLKEEGFSND